MSPLISDKVANSARDLFGIFDVREMRSFQKLDSSILDKIWRIFIFCWVLAGVILTLKKQDRHRHLLEQPIMPIGEFQIEICRLKILAYRFGDTLNMKLIFGALKFDLRNIFLNKSREPFDKARMRRATETF